MRNAEGLDNVLREALNSERKIEAKNDLRGHYIEEILRSGKTGVAFAYASEPVGFPHPSSNFEAVKPMCTFCNRTGHTAERCFYNKCQFCQEPWHSAQNCPQLQKTNEQCQLCNTKGQNAISCNKNPGNIKCQLCNRDGHEARTCRVGRSLFPKSTLPSVSLHK